jgi:hypothetical protein
MRWLCVLLATTGCGFDCDPDAWIVRIAGPTAIACGHVDFWDRNSPSPADVRACISSALAEHAAFYASVDAGVADGREMVGYAFAGGDTAPIRVFFGGSIPATGVGPTTEDHGAVACASLAVGPPCESMAADLCLICDAPTEIPATASRSTDPDPGTCPSP